MAIQAYWFTAGDTLPHGDGRKIVLGETHRIKGKLVLCKHALHWSRHPLDALQYAPGPFLYRVEPGGRIVEQGDKGGSTERKYLDMRDATPMLHLFTRKRALSVIHLWAAPAIVREYLETGNESKRAAAEAASRAAEAAWVASRAASRAAAAGPPVFGRCSIPKPHSLAVIRSGFAL